MGKVVKTVIGVAVAIGIAIAAPYLAPLALTAIGITATATAVAIATAVIAVGLSVAATLGMKALGLTQGAPKTAAGPPTIFRQSIADSFIIYGRRRVGGLIVFLHGKKSGSDHFRYFVIAVAGHRCAGNPEFMLNDEVVTVNGSNMVTSGKYANAAWLWFDRGESTATANATFVSECDGKWTTDHRGRGIAKIYAKFKMTDAVIEAGMPNITAIIDGCDEIYDPRDESTGYSNNAALVFYHWLQLPREEGGFGAYPDEIPDDDWLSAQANVCDEEIEGEARYALDGVIVTGAAPSEIRDVLTVSCAGTYTYSEGKHLMRVGYWVSPSETLQEADLAGQLVVSAFSSGDVSANEVQGQFVDPDAGYQASAFATQRIESDDVRQSSLDLAFVTSKYRAERIARIMLLRAQAEKTVVAPMNISALAVRALDTVQFATERYSLSNYAFTVVGWQLSADFGIVLSLKEENEDIYADPEPVSPPSVPAIQQGEIVLTTREIETLIANSYTVPSRVLEASESGGSGSIVIADHDRVYAGDGASISLTGATITGLLTDTPYFIYYDDANRDDTTPTYVATTDGEVAQTGYGRHSLGRIRTPITGSGITYAGGGVYPTGSTIGGEVEGPLP